MIREAGAAEWERFVAHYSTLRGLVRDTLVARQVQLHIAPAPARVVDVGGGAGHQAIRLARDGYEVTLVDPSDQMLASTRDALRAEAADIRARVRLFKGRGDEAPALLGTGQFDAVLCHGVLMHLPDPGPMVTALAGLARRGAVVSLLAKNRDALAMRAALEGRWQEALAAFGADYDVGGLGVPTRGDTLTRLWSLMRAAGIEPVAWYGVRVFTDHAGDRFPGADADEILSVEWEAGRRDPYRAVARLIHVIGTRT
ncbi:MAG: methyltransferase domain-containing protein [Chloroflexota bacterium]|nr:methyltransferase domain-containing protein [Chloroflexota bacterium]